MPKRTQSGIRNLLTVLQDRLASRLNFASGLFDRTMYLFLAAMTGF
jgi:hypothetical protein